MEVMTRTEDWNPVNLPEKHDGTKASKSTSDGKVKRKAPAIPVVEDKNATAGVSSINDNQSQRKPNGLNQSSRSSTTWSTTSSSEYSPSSNSFSSSSLSDGTPTTRKPELTIQRVGTKSKGDVNIENEQLEKPQNYNPAVVEKGNEQTGAKPSVTDSNVAGVNQDLVGPKVDQEGVNCSSLSDYVENAISNSNILSSSPSRSDEGTEQPPPPRLLSFESSSNLHQDGSLKLAPDNASAVKLDYVSLDFVRSAAAVERRGKKDKDDDESTARSNSSLSSSIISSIDSEDGSTIGSDVVENLYNKITAAAVRHSSKSSLQHLGPEQQTGDIEKDLYPLIFPGRRRNSADNVGGGTGNFDFIRPPSQSVTSPAEKVESFLRQNLNNNNNNSQRVTDKSTPLAESVGDHALENKSDLKTQEYSICSNCSKVLYDSESEMNDAIHKARDILGRCMCNSDEVYDPIIEIDYCNSNLKEVPSDIWDHAHTLIKLLMESNTITELPKELFTCQNLQYLSVSDNDIGVLPPCLASLVNLQHLDVSKNVIEDVPECIRCCKNLQVLDASVNPVERLSEGFTQLISLRELYMNDCFFDFLPANFGRMSQLVVLELRDNQLQILPKSMRRLTQLSRLDLGGNVFQEWPDVIGELRNLSELWLDCNELSKVPPAIGSLTKLTYLDLSRNYLETFPSQIGSLDKLKDLLLSENSLASIPDTIGFLKDLVICNLESNQLTSVPETFGKLASLEELDLSHNKIEQLPSSVGKLKSLQTLLLDDNQLTELPVEVGSCLSLKIFQISRNQIEELPESIGNLTDLRVLNLTQNKLPYLPISMIKLARLNALWITPNQSKPNVPLHAELHQESGKRILTNILFPQKDKGFAQGTKLLSILDDDDDNYANDAADDDDPVQYAQRPRGITHVVFNLDATTYSTDALHMAENFVKNNEEQEPENSSDKPTSQTTEIPAPVIEVDIKPAPKAALESDDFSVIVSDNFKPTGLSVLGPPSGGENDKPTMKTANILKVKPSTEVTSTKPAAKLIEEAGNMRSTTSKTVKADDLSADEDNLPPTSPQGIRAWTSHSHLPALSTLRAKEELAAKEGLSKSEIDLLDSVADTPMHQSKQSGGSVTDIAAAKSGTSKSNDELKAIFEKRPAEPSSFNNASNLLDRLDQLANRNRGGTQATAGRTMPADVTTGKELHAPSSGAVIAGKEVHSTQGRKSRDSKKPVAAALDSIPFMDEADEDLKVAGDRESDDGALDQTLQEFSIDKEATKAVSEELSTKREQLASAENNYALSADFVTEGKSSSVTSGESLPATDHDSGVGNDVESQESIPDDGNEVTGALHKNAMHLARKPTFDTNTTQVGESTALRRNKGGWIALVRTDQPQAEPTSSGITSNDQVFAAAPSPSVTSQAQRNKAAEKRSNQLHFAPNITVDSTTVTYSFDYNNARQPGQVSPNKASAGNNNNKVTENIKKFEKFFEGGYPGPRRASADLTGMKTSKSLNQLQEIQSPQNVARKPPPPVKPKALSQPKTLSLQNIPPAPPSGGTPKPNKVSFSTERRVSDNTREESQVDVSHADTSLENEMSEVDRTLEQLSLRRQAGHQKKSKFEEALAATKHKHFRDKLEKMMQQKAPLTPGRRPSRNSTSPLANIPRITSPVPMALSPHGKFTPLENLTAEDTWSNGQKDPSRPVERSSQQSVHERLKEKLQPKTIEPNSSQSATSRARQSSASTSRPFGRRGSTHRSSIRSLGGNETDDKEDSQDAESKKTIEEQLGQLLLDGTSSPGHKNDQGFVTYVPNEEMYNERRMQSPPPVSRSVGAFGQATRKPPPPSDWKDQLLRHIERKKQEKFEVNGLHPHLHPQQPMRVTSPSRHIEAGYTASASSASSSTHGDTNYSKVDNRNFPRNNEARRSFNRPSEVARKPEGQNRAMSRSVTAPEAIGSIPQPGGKRESLTQPSNFVRSSNDGPRQPAGRRSSGRFLRTRTPGPESVASSGKHVESIVRPKSAMDMPTNSFQMSGFDKTNDMPSQIQKPRALPAVAPPTYEAHMLRRKPPSNGSKKNYESDYVNVEYVDQMRASGRRKEKRDKTQPNKEHVEQDPQSAFPLRASGSHESVLNSKMEKTNPYEAAMPNPAMMRGSNSQDSMLDKTYPKHYSLPAHSQPPTHHGRRGNGAANVPVARAPYPYEPINYQPPRQSSRSQGHKPVQKHPDKHSGQYGFIPAPSKTRPPKIPPRDHPVHVSKKHRQPHDDYMVLPDRRFPVDPYYLPPPPAFHDDYQETMPPLSPSLQRSYGEREDESVASAFRPYHQHQLNQRHSQAPAPKHNPYQQHYPQQQPPQPQHYDVRYNNQRGNVIDHHRHHHQLDRGAKQELQYGYHENPPHQYHPTMEEDLSAGSEPSLSGEISRHWREADAAAELVTVTVMKNPTFGFHIMGGIDSGGNPYRPDDDGVFITYVAPGGAADGQVQPGDKILLVNGSDFVGITHKRAVDLLRNAGQVAVLVVERLVGRPV